MCAQVINQTEDHRYRVLVDCAANLRVWNIKVHARLQTVYDAWLRVSCIWMNIKACTNLQAYWDVLLIGIVY